MKKIELLAPAKNLEFGREAVNHGADALYIGAPAYGARAAATNSIEDIEELVRYSHLFGCKVFATVNTVLFNVEMDNVVKMIGQLYNIGVDALIIQDMGLLECDLPPIELHASTQCHNTTAERILFLEQAGFKRVVLARETTLEEIRGIRKSTNIDLEAFVHGALCVSFSGQCYMSQYLTGRSGNRGCCSQPCRSRYDLLTADGRLLLKDRHLLSLRDFNASQHVDSMIEAGITSFKIEGRLKDLSYVKNVTAYYRRLFDCIMERDGKNDIPMSCSSSGRCTFYFTPDVERTFNRGYTDYFLSGRKLMASFDTQKSIGKKVGVVSSIGSRTLTVSSDEKFSKGDGLCYFDGDGNLQGFLVNDVNGRTLLPNKMPVIRPGTQLWRNNDIDFERQLKSHSSERLINVEMTLSVRSEDIILDLKDEDGVTASARVNQVNTPAENQEKMSCTIIKQMSKLGGTIFRATKVLDDTKGQFFIPVSVLNELRRNAVDELIRNRISHFHPADQLRVDHMPTYPTPTVGYHANIVNSRAEKFYKKHGTRVLERGIDQTDDYAGKALMTTKYCLRYELGCCLCGKSRHVPLVAIEPHDSLIISNNGRQFSLHFDCNECQMQVFSENSK